jgi:hypothetical protein
MSCDAFLLLGWLLFWLLCFCKYAHCSKVYRPAAKRKNGFAYALGAASACVPFADAPPCTVL